MSKIQAQWSLFDTDNKKLYRPQQPIDQTQGLSITSGAVFAEQGRFGHQDPLINWVRGKTKTFSFEAVIFARDSKEDIRPLMDGLDSLARKQDSLGRPPICVFTWGASVRQLVVVENADHVIRSITASGLPREVRFQLSLRKYVPFKQSNIDPTAPVKESYYHPAGDSLPSYEEIAKLYYGNPMLGINLRKRHPQAPFAPLPGMEVKIPARSIVNKEPVEPSSHIFDLDDPDASSAYEVVLSDKEKRQVVITR